MSDTAGRDQESHVVGPPARSVLAGIKLAHVWSSDMGAVHSLPYLEHFARLNVRQYVIVPDGPRVARIRDIGVQVLPLSLTRRLLDFRADMRACRELMSYFRQERFDIIHTHNTIGGLVGRFAAGLVRAPAVVHTVHGVPFGLETPQPKRVLHASCERLASYGCHRVLVQSREDEQTFILAKAAPREKVVRIGNGIPLKRFDPDRWLSHRDQIRASLGFGPSDVVFLSAGRLVREKGFMDLARATAIARRSADRIKVVIAGPADEQKADSLSASDMESARQDGVRFLGEREDMAALYAASDVVVLPSWREGLPRVLVEGAAMGKPLLATDVRGNREVVRVPSGGVLTPVRNPDALAGGMVRLASDETFRNRLGDHNRLLARTEYDITRVFERLEGAYIGLLASKPL